MAVKGVDISGNNGQVDFAALKRAGAEFAIIRCGYGGDYTDQDDDFFFENLRGAKDAAMPYGVYLYSYALNAAQAESEAAHALRLLKQTGRPAYGVWLDMEDADHYKKRYGFPSSHTLVDICGIFCETLQNAGYYCGVYASLNWWRDYLNSLTLNRYDKWVAQYNAVCDYKKPYGMWQFTDGWEIGGKRFDGNWAYRDYPALTRGKEEEDGMTKADVLKIIREYEAEKAEKPASRWAGPALEFCREKGILTGGADGDMRPQSYVTRQEAAQIAMRLYQMLAELD